MSGRDEHARTAPEPRLPAVMITRSIHPLSVVVRTRRRCYQSLIGFEVGRGTWRWYAFVQFRDKTIWIRRSI
jgi:hypothetical protein